ncbi:MAG: tetratricopeptide repeat protein [Gammaproteobacteria bacterium]|nr:tetratricopeptide repeat protein [Gammaproteobacteria bacterium]
MSSSRNKRRIAKNKRGKPANQVDLTGQKLSHARRLHESGRLYEEEQIYKSILAQNPGHLQSLVMLGKLALQAGHIGTAVDIFNRAVKSDLTNPNCYYLLGMALQKLGNSQEAEAMLREANELDKNSPDILNALGLTVSYQGLFDEALQLFRHAIKIDPDYIPAYHNLSTSKKFTVDDADLKMIEEVYRRRRDFSVANKSSICFAMGKVYNDLAQYDVAFEAYDEGNKTVRKQHHFDIRDFEDNYLQVEKYFAENTVNKTLISGGQQEVPIFVLGMPRSGTTLVENILCNHSGVSSIGESALIRETLDQFSQVSGLTKAWNAQNIYEFLDSIDNDSLKMAGEYYVENMKKNVVDMTESIIDKTSLNFLVVGFILRILPNAIIIHCTRSPMDTCLSIFQQHFSIGHDYAFSLTEIGQFYNLYQRYMKLWHKEFPSKIIDISYESLISDTENETRRLLASCNLPWEEQCLSRKSVGNSFNTASKLQVRQSIYQTSVERWRRYEKHLAPLILELEQ